MGEVREDEEVDRPIEDGGVLVANCPVPGEDAESSSAYALRLSMLKQRRKTWFKYGVTERTNKEIL